MLSVRHCSASGRLDEGWSYDHRVRRVEALVRMGSVSLPVSFLICAQVRPVFGAHPIIRRDGESWLVLPVRFERRWPRGIEVLEPMPCPIADDLTPGEQLAITHCPDVVSELLETL